jgi:Tol biopolymer transport system component
MSMIGKSLIHYEITSEIGKGGMGEVYQAKDTKLGRDVAIKVLPEEFALDKDRVARFQREAKLLASLNHPNIAAIYGLEESDGVHFLVMELIEGDTLKDRIKTGPIPVEEALKFALQMAEALEAAHEKGVIHRDLKPANIKVTPDGKVKILDFGLAKAYAGDQENINLADSPTISAAATQQGVILGTAAYMSPEQARGKPVDRRADIWAFGVVLYEMLTGRPTFSGDDVTDTLAAVIRSEPEWKNLPANLHWRLKEVLERCLEKKAKDRYGSISDARVDIQRALADPSGILVRPISVAEPRTHLQMALPWIVAIFGIIIVGIIVWYLRAPTPERPQVMYFTDEAPQGLQIGPTDSFTISPDGRKFVYGTNKGFYIRSIDNPETRLIAETDEQPSNLFFSPDGRWIGYWSRSERKLKKIALSGGAPIVLCDTGMLVLGAMWHTDDTIIYSQIPDGIKRVSAGGGNPEPLIQADFANMRESGFPMAPQMLPDGKAILYTGVISINPLRGQIVLYSLESGKKKVLFEGIGAEYLPTGHLVYLLGNVGAGNIPDMDLFAVPFDVDALKVTGDSVSMLEGIVGGTVSKSGTMAYISRTALVSESGTGAEPESAAEPAGRTLVWVDRQGQETIIEEAPSYNYSFPRISPDGTRVCLTAEVKGNMDIWVWDFAEKNLARFTFADQGDSVGIWTPDGQRITFSSVRGVLRRGGITALFWKAADGTGEVEFLASIPGKLIIPWSWSIDGKDLVVSAADASFSKQEISIVSMESDREAQPLLPEGGQVQVSPDGKWIAYCIGNLDQGTEIYVHPFPDVNNGRWQVSTDGGNSPLWSPDSRELFYLTGDYTADAIMRVPVETEPTFKCGKPELLFRGTYIGYWPNNGTPWDIHLDGKRFLMMKGPVATEEESAPQEPAEEVPLKINIIVNWFEELKERAPVD